VFGSQPGILNTVNKPRRVCLAQHWQALLQQVAGIAAKKSDVGHDAQGSQIQQALALGGPAANLV
jgi:hypothetical protein